MKKFLLAFFLAAGCTSFNGIYLKYTVEEHHDKFDNFSEVSLEPIPLGSSTGTQCQQFDYFYVGQPRILVGFHQITSDTDSSKKLFMDVQYTGKEWMFASGDLVLRHASKNTELRAQGDPSRDAENLDSGLVLFEKFHVPITYKLAKELFAADDLEFKIRGQKGYVVGCFPASAQNSFRRFLTEKVGIDGLTYTAEVAIDAPSHRPGKQP